MALDGEQVVILANVGTTASPNYQVVAEQTNLDKESTRNLIEVTNKDNDHQKWLYGKKGDTITLESLYVPNDAAMQALRDALDNAETILLRRQEEGSEVEEATGLIETITDSWPDNDSSTVSIDITMDEAWSAI